MALILVRTLSLSIQSYLLLESMCFLGEQIFADLLFFYFSPPDLSLRFESFIGNAQCFVAFDGNSAPRYDRHLDQSSLMLALQFR